MGIDHHRQYSHITLVDEKGEKLKSRRVVNLRSELEKFLQGMDDTKAVIEAGRSSYTMVDLLDDLGVEVTVAHPKEVKAIARAKIKTDKRDSYILAHLLRTDLIPAHIATEGVLCWEPDAGKEPDSGAFGAAVRRSSGGDLSGKESFWHKGDEGARGAFITCG